MKLGSTQKKSEGAGERATPPKQNPADAEVRSKPKIKKNRKDSESGSRDRSGKAGGGGKQDEERQTNRTKAQKKNRGGNYVEEKERANGGTREPSEFSGTSTE